MRRTSHAKGPGDEVGDGEIARGARGADQACERFVHSIVKTTRFYGY